MSITAILAYLATSVFGVAELPERWETLINAAAPVIAGYLWPDRADAGSPGNDGGPQQNPRGGIETPLVSVVRARSSALSSSARLSGARSI
jgi:hypothetical protein